MSARDKAEGGEKTKIAVLGAGMGSIAAMYSLTQLPENREKYDITCYTMGWRVGGKGASARNQQMGGRIEEHGLHLWFGFYDNSFKVMKDAYEELARSPTLPLHSFETAFTPHDYVVLMDEYEGKWRSPWEYRFAENSGEPGEGGDLPSFWSLLSLLVYWLSMGLDAIEKKLGEKRAQSDDERHHHDKGSWWGKLRELVDDVGEELEALERVPARYLLPLVAKAVAALAEAAESLDLPFVREMERIVIELTEKFRAWLWEEFGGEVDDDEVRRFLVLADFGTTTIIGGLEDQVHRKGIFSIDDVELSDWLTKYGANRTTLTCPIVRGLYDNIFAYEGGDKSKPNAAAGTSILWLMRMLLTYKGHLMYKMNAGMGDTIFTPFHRVLVSRGVKFEFFQCVQDLKLDAAKEGIEAIQIMPQVELTVDEYDPYVSVNGLPCWPNQPNWDQIRNGQELSASGVDLQNVCCPDPDREPIRLERGKDFDLVILGIPIAATAKITKELYDNRDKPQWKAMVDNIQTVQTQAYQLWLNEDLDDLGWTYGGSPVLGTYHELLDTYADMSHLIPVENQPASERVANIAYFCGAQRNFATQEESDADCYRNSLDDLKEYMPRLWKKLVEPDGSIDWDLLVDPGNGSGEARFRAQFFRANWTESERYTLSVAGSTKYRLKTDATGYDNLRIVGDWIDNNFNSGCIEACTMSGMQASRSLCGYPKKIVGEAPDLFAGDRND